MPRPPAARRRRLGGILLDTGPLGRDHGGYPGAGAGGDGGGQPVGGAGRAVAVCVLVWAWRSPGSAWSAGCLPPWCCSRWRAAPT